MAEGKKYVKAPSVAEGYRETDLGNGFAETSGRVSAPSSHPQAPFSGALKKWEIWSLDTENVFLQADGLRREASLRAKVESGPSGANRIREPNVAEYGFADAPAAPQNTRQLYLLRAEETRVRVGLKMQASSFEP